jgi:hypothetical protein
MVSVKTQPFLRGALLPAARYGLPQEEPLVVNANHGGPIGGYWIAGPDRPASGLEAFTAADGWACVSAPPQGPRYSRVRGWLRGASPSAQEITSSRKEIIFDS